MLEKCVASLTLTVVFVREYYFISTLDSIIDLVLVFKTCALIKLHITYSDVLSRPLY